MIMWKILYVLLSFNTT